MAGDLTITSSGAIDASARQAGRDVAASGGYVMISGGDLLVGEARVTAMGAVGQTMNVSGPKFSNMASPGYVVLATTTTVTGTTTPPANVIIR